MCIRDSFFVHHYAQTNGSDSDTVWIWFGMRSDGRCGRDFGTDYVKETKCGGEGCCSSHGWCGHGEEYCSVALGCQSGCWPDERTEEQKAEAAEGGQHYDDDDYGGGGHHGEYGHHGYRADE